MSTRAKKAWKIGCAFCAFLFFIAVLFFINMGYQFTRNNYRIPGTNRVINYTAHQALGPGAIEISFPTESGATVPGYYRAGDTDAAILLLHGLGGTRVQLSHIARRLNEQGWAVLLIDQRGHGEHPLNLTTFGRAESLDALGAIEWLRERDDIDPGRIGIYGASMGATTCIHAASQDPDIACAVADSSYAVFDDQVKFELERDGPKVRVPERWRAFFINLFQRYEPVLIGEWANYPDPVDTIKDIQCPLFLIHGELDMRIQADDLNKLSAAAREADVPVTTWQVQDEAHCTYHDTEEFYNRLIYFFRQHL